jgi:hypothetical protein
MESPKEANASNVSACPYDLAFGSNSFLELDFYIIPSIQGIFCCGNHASIDWEIVQPDGGCYAVSSEVDGFVTYHARIPTLIHLTAFGLATLTVTEGLD